MKRSNYVVLMVIGFVAMMFMPVVTCRAEWIYLGSEVSSGPTSGSGGDSNSGWSFEISSISTSADSSGATASATCEAECWAEVTGGTMSRSPYASCSSSGTSRYMDDNPPNPFYVSWSLSGSGTVEVAGEVDSIYFVTGDSGDSGASASGSISSHEYGSAGASGSVSEYSNGSASVATGGYAEEDSSTVNNGYQYYSALLSYDVDGYDYIGFDGEEEDFITQYTANAQIGASASCSASVSATYFGNVWATSDASAGGSASVSVSW